MAQGKSKVPTGDSAEGLELRIAQEHEEQARWRGHQEGPALKPFVQLVDREFLPEEQQRAGEARHLGQMLHFAFENVPYYRDLAAETAPNPAELDPLETLSRLPELNKTILREQEQRMRAEALPAGQKPGNSHTSSGSTGEPIRVYQTEYARFLRLALTQRQLRWYRYDPNLSMAVVKSAVNLPKHDDKLLRPGQTLREPHWPGVGRYFVTGPTLNFLITNPIDAKADWLSRHECAYLFTTTSVLEHLALIFQERPPLRELRGVRAMSEPLTNGMRSRIEQGLNAPLSISYGLNETGWLATRCPEGDRYHVHTEHCLIEVVDDSGAPCRAGEYGRVLVTILSNAAMPLIRYDTDDIAMAVEGPCPCGRTLPAFGDIIGRHSQMESLPHGTQTIVDALRSCMESLPSELSFPLREYQLRQTAQGGFQLFLILARTRATAFDRHVREVFHTALGNAAYAYPTPSLNIIETERIPRTRSKKFFHFVSEFSPPVLEKDQAPRPSKRD